MTTVVHHQKQPMLPQYGRFQTLQTHVLQAMDNEKKTLLTRDMLEKVLTLLIPNRVLVFERKGHDKYRVIHANIIDVETGEVLPDGDLFDNKASINGQHEAYCDPVYLHDGAIVIRCIGDSQQPVEFNMKVLNCPLIYSYAIDIFQTETKRIQRLYSLETSVGPGFLFVTELSVNETIYDSDKIEKKQRSLLIFKERHNYPQFFAYIKLRNNRVLFDIGFNFILFDLEKDEVIQCKQKLDGIPRFCCGMIQLLNGLVAVIGGHQLSFDEDANIHHKYFYDVTLYDPDTLEVVSTKEFDVRLIFAYKMMLLHDGRMLLISNYLGIDPIPGPLIFDPEDMTLTTQPPLTLTNATNVRWIDTAHLVPFSPF